MLNDIAREVRRFGPEDWGDYVNVRTSLLYVLSGGDARVLKPLIESNSLSDADQKLAAGIMSFAEGQTRAARKYFKDIDPRSLDVSLVGPFALAELHSIWMMTGQRPSSCSTMLAWLAPTPPSTKRQRAEKFQRWSTREISPAR